MGLRVVLRFEIPPAQLLHKADKGLLSAAHDDVVGPRVVILSRHMSLC